MVNCAAMTCPSLCPSEIVDKPISFLPRENYCWILLEKKPYDCWHKNIMDTDQAIWTLFRTNLCIDFVNCWINFRILSTVLNNIIQMFISFWLFYIHFQKFDVGEKKYWTFSGKILSPFKPNKSYKISMNFKIFDKFHLEFIFQQIKLKILNPFRISLGGTWIWNITTNH